MKNSIDTIGIRTRDLPACNAVHQPITPPRGPCVYLYIYIYSFFQITVDIICCTNGNAWNNLKILSGTDVALNQPHINAFYFTERPKFSFHFFQLNQPTRCSKFSSLLLDVYLQLNMFQASCQEPCHFTDCGIAATQVTVMRLLHFRTVKIKLSVHLSTSHGFVWGSWGFP